jgi:hypothetical protein
MGNESGSCASVLRRNAAPRLLSNTNVFSDFGRTRSYNVRSVDGVLLHDGEHVVKDAERFSGEMLMDNFSSDCWELLKNRHYTH